MVLSTLRVRPGVNVQLTPTLLGALGWSASQLVRFKDGMPQKLGGWTHLNASPLVGTGRGMKVWSDLNGVPYAAVGTEQRLTVMAGGALFDITPLRKTDNPAVDFSTTITSKTVTIADLNHGGATGDWVSIIVPVSVGGLIIQGLFQITVIDGNTYTVQANLAATATVSHGGAVPVFNSTNGQPTLQVTFANHGFLPGDQFEVQVATTIATIVMAAFSIFSVSSVVDANHFVITPGGNANATTTVSENAGNAHIGYLIQNGFASATAITGYGIGPYGAGPYGIGSTGSIVSPLRQWFLDNWGQDLIGNFSGSTLYFWPPPFTNGNIATPTGGTTPAAMTASFVAMPQQIAVALGAEILGVQDPNLIRWSDVSDFADWVATAVNQAGSFRLPTGSKIVGGLQGPQFGCIWTDVDFWLMQYLSVPLVFGFQKVASGCSLMSARAAGVYNNVVYWASAENFYLFDGNSVQVLPCAVWDKFFSNLNTQQIDKVWCWVNSAFNEVWWFYPSATGTGEVDSYIKYQTVDRVWDFGVLPRTCGSDTNPLGTPIAVDTAGLIQQHEVSNDADGQAMMSSITSGFLSIEDGTLFTFIERLLPDFILRGGNQRVFISIITADYSSDIPPTTRGPFAVTPATPYFPVRARGRVAAVTITSNDLGVFWRLGALRYVGAPAGRRA